MGTGGGCAKYGNMVLGDERMILAEVGICGKVLGPRGGTYGGADLDIPGAL